MAQETVDGGVKNGSTDLKPVVFSALKPQLFVEAPKASDAVQFFKVAFGAEEVNRVMNPKRKADQELPLILSAELKLGSSVIIVSDLATDDTAFPVKSAVGGVFCLETEDVEAAMEKASKAGAVVDGEVTEGDCCGGRVGQVKDPYGNVWMICSSTKKPADVEA